MEAVSTKFHKGIKRWKRGGEYERLNAGSTGCRKKCCLGVVGTSSTEPSCSNRKRKLRNKIAKLLSRLGDVYVNCLDKMSNSGVAGGFGGEYGGESYGRRALKEYDERMLIEAYKCSVVYQGIGFMY